MPEPELVLRFEEHLMLRRSVEVERALLSVDFVGERSVSRRAACGFGILVLEAR